MHILSQVTDNFPSWISGWERMTIEKISWSISTKECCRTGASNSRPPNHQSSVHPTELPSPADGPMCHLWISCDGTLNRLWKYCSFPLTTMPSSRLCFFVFETNKYGHLKMEPQFEVSSGGINTWLWFRTETYTPNHSSPILQSLFYAQLKKWTDSLSLWNLVSI